MQKNVFYLINLVIVYIQYTYSGVGLEGKQGRCISWSGRNCAGNLQRRDDFM